MALIEVRRLCVAERLDEVSFFLEAGEMLGVIGPNGSGKSSLLKSLAGILPATGDIRFLDAPLAALSPEERARRIGFLPQFCDSAWPLAVEDVVSLGRLPWRDRDEEAIQQAIRETDIEPLRKKRIDCLSGGEQARVWLARVLATRPRLILADEPIASLDLFYQAKIMRTLRRHADGEHGVIIALHDLALAAHHCDRLCLMRHGKIHAFGPPQKVLDESALSEIFGVPIHVDLAHTPPIVLPDWDRGSGIRDQESEEANHAYTDH
ncbi:MAG: ABC transporter ATP-binding protein [Zoogloeaceae bacterium]|jgi:iron complex transport system ATP-binding protein|nr:ABC transporter ATP-binding protein [Zoogloeaceae bacterium]